MPGLLDYMQHSSLLSPEYKNSPQRSWVTKLPEWEQQPFMDWVQQNQVPYDPSPYADYDMPGFWRALQAKDPRAVSGMAPDGRLHFTDAFKTPYHKSFSNESRYSTSPNDPNWDKNRLMYMGRALYQE
jgi:hypothetical protein